MEESAEAIVPGQEEREGPNFLCAGRIRPDDSMDVES